MKKTILVLGGAGYIGSHTAYLLYQQGYHIIIVDNFFHNQSFSHDWAHVIRADFSDKTILKNIFSTYNISAVMHFAAFIEVGESVKKPREFYENNVLKVLKLLAIMLEHNITKFIFSSSCAVYGNPLKIPMDEQHPTAPISPYGKNKLAVEFALQDYAQAYDFTFVSLRYFNAAGALPEKNLGEQHDPETHIIPLLLRAIINNKKFHVFGNDYDTIDGTCVRDYIHVLDIAQAHLLALKYLEGGGQSDFFNLGSEEGHTVLQIIQAAEKMCNKKALINMCPRRPGDAEVLLANSSKAQKKLNWKPKKSNLKNILHSAYTWECKNNQIMPHHLTCNSTLKHKGVNDEGTTNN